MEDLAVWRMLIRFSNTNFPPPSMREALELRRRAGGNGVAFALIQEEELLEFQNSFFSDCVILLNQ